MMTTADLTATGRSPYTGHKFTCATYATLDASDCDCNEEPDMTTTATRRPTRPRHTEDGHETACLSNAMICAIENARDSMTSHIDFRRWAQGNGPLEWATEYLADGSASCVCPPLYVERWDGATYTAWNATGVIQSAALMGCSPTECETCSNPGTYVIASCGEFVLFQCDDCLVRSWQAAEDGEIDETWDFTNCR